MKLPQVPTAEAPIRLRCMKERCKVGGYIPRDEMMPPGTVTVFQPCDKHEEDGYLDLQIIFHDKDGVALDSGLD